MGKYQEEKKTPIIMVKKRRTLLPPSLSEKTGVIARSETVKMEDPVSVGSSSPAVDTHPPEASASKKKRKRRRFPRQPHWTHEFTHNCVEKVKSLFPHLRAESGKRLVRTVLIFTESSDQLSRATDRVPGLPASPGYVQ